MNRELARVRLDNNRVYRYLRRLTRVMDDYYLDSSILSKINRLRQEFSQNSFQVQF